MTHAKRPVVILLVGGNGAGKSTFYNTYLAPRKIPFLNADVLAREMWPDAPEAHSYEAMRLVERSRHLALAQQRSFCFETVFSHPSKLDFIHEAKCAGYAVELYAIHLTAIPLNRLRVEQRVGEGGHAVPEAKIGPRVERSLGQLIQALPVADQALLLDNSRVHDPFRIQARFHQGRLLYAAEALEPWAKTVIDAFQSE
ncbi:zeta toxin family protein [Marinimicrobium locisalis]|uniref:zeta toxin family protein n=1 Tax=Marinimicrobium locisalis TaxID=546022 RepID=UPI003221C902